MGGGLGFRRGMGILRGVMGRKVGFFRWMDVDSYLGR